MTDQVLHPQAFEWETKPPLHSAGGFLMVAGNVWISMGYAVFKEGVLLQSYTRIGDNQPQPWLRHWTSHLAAVEMAELMVCNAEEYLGETLGQAIREVEDLDGDDFIEHLRIRLANEFH